MLPEAASWLWLGDAVRALAREWEGASGTSAWTAVLPIAAAGAMYGSGHSRAWRSWGGSALMIPAVALCIATDNAAGAILLAAKMLKLVGGEAAGESVVRDALCDDREDSIARRVVARRRRLRADADADADAERDSGSSENPPRTRRYKPVRRRRDVATAERGRALVRRDRHVKHRVTAAACVSAS